MRLQLPVGRLGLLLLALALLLPSCASPVVLEVEEGTIVIDNLGTVTGKGLAYRRGLLRNGEAAATWSGPVYGWPEPRPLP